MAPHPVEEYTSSSSWAMVRSHQAFDLATETHPGRGQVLSICQGDPITARTLSPRMYREATGSI